MLLWSISARAVRALPAPSWVGRTEQSAPRSPVPRTAGREPERERAARHAEPGERPSGAKRGLRAERGAHHRRGQARAGEGAGRGAAPCLGVKDVSMCIKEGRGLRPCPSPMGLCAISTATPPPRG